MDVSAYQLATLRTHLGDAVPTFGVASVPAQHASSKRAPEFRQDSVPALRCVSITGNLGYEQRRVTCAETRGRDARDTATRNRRGGSDSDSSQLSGDAQGSVPNGAAMPHANDRAYTENACAFAKRGGSRSAAVLCSGLADAGADPGYGDGDGGPHCNNGGSGLAATVHLAAAHHQLAASQVRDAPRLSESAADALVLLASSAGGGSAGAVSGQGAIGRKSQPPHTVALSFGSWGRQTGLLQEKGHASRATAEADAQVALPLPVGAVDTHPQQRRVSEGAALLGKRRSSMADNNKGDGGDGHGALATGAGDCNAEGHVPPHSRAVLAAVAAVAAAGARGAASRCFNNNSLRPLAAATTTSCGQASAGGTDEAEADAAAAAGGGADAYGDDEDVGDWSMRMMKHGRQPESGHDLRTAAKPGGSDGEAEDMDAQQQQMLLVEEMVERASSLCSTAAGGARHAVFGRGSGTSADQLLLLHQAPRAAPLLLDQLQQQHAHSMAQLLLGGVGGRLQPRRISHLAAPAPAAVAGPRRGLCLHVSAPVCGVGMPPCSGAAPAGVMAGTQAGARSLRLVGGSGGASGAGVAAVGRVLDLDAARVSAENFEGRLADILRGCGGGDVGAAALLQANQHHSVLAACAAAGCSLNGIATGPLAPAVTRLPPHPRGSMPRQQHPPVLAAAGEASTSPAGNQASAALPPVHVLQQQGQGRGQEQLGEDPRSTEELLALGREVASRLMRVQRAKESLRRMEGSLVAEARNLRLLLHQRRRQQMELQQQAAATAAAAPADAEAAAQPTASERRQSEAPAARRVNEAALAVDAATDGLHASTTPTALKLVLLGAAADSANAGLTATDATPAIHIPLGARTSSAALSTGTPPASPLARSGAAGAATATVPSFARKSTDSANTSRRAGTSPAVLFLKVENGTGSASGVAGVDGHELPTACDVVDVVPSSVAIAAAATTAEAPHNMTDRRNSESSQEKSAGGAGGTGSAVPSAALLKAALAVAGVQSVPPAAAGAAPLVGTDVSRSPRPGNTPAGDCGVAAPAPADDQDQRVVKRARVC